MLKAIHEMDGCSASVCSASCKLMEKRGYNDPDKTWMLDTPVVEYTLDAMKKFPNEKEVNRDCAMAIGAIAINNAELSSRLGDAGAVEIINNMIRRYMDDGPLQSMDLMMGGMSGCLMGFVRENRIRWAKDGGIELNLKYMRKWYKEPGVVLQAAYSFSSGAQEPNEELFEQKGVIDDLAKMFMDWRMGYRIREEIMEATRHLAQHSWQIREKMVRANFIQAFKDEFTAVPNEKHRLQLACANLNILASANNTYLSFAARTGVPALALAAANKTYNNDDHHITYMEDTYTTREDCLELVNTLATDPKGRGKDNLIEAKAVEIADAITKSDGASMRLREDAIKLKSTLQR